MDAILNWVWQGSSVAIGTAAVLRTIGPHRAQDRYASLWIALLSVLLLPVVPLAWAAVSSARVAVLSPTPVASVVVIPAAWGVSSAIIITLWAVWVSVQAAAVASAVLAVRRAKRRCAPFPPDVEARLLRWTSVRAGGRRSTVVLSSSIRSAAVLGCGSPMIAVAPALLDHLEDEDLDRVLIHEWAHVQRRDELAVLVQLFIRAVAGWHPAVWWLQRQLHLEREVACDEMAVALTGLPKQYAACLTKLASLPPPRGVAPAAVGALSSSHLRRRIVRLLSHAQVGSAPTRRARARAIAGGVWPCLASVTLGGMPLIESELPMMRTGVAAPAPAVELHAPSSTVAAPHDAARPTSSGRGPRTRQTSERRRQPVTTTMAAVASTTAPTPVQPAARGESATERPPTAIAAVANRWSAHDWRLPTVVRGRAETTDLSRSSGSRTETRGWGAAADAGAAIGRSSQKAGLSTAGFFSRFGKAVASSF